MDYTYELMRAMLDFNINKAKGLIEHSQYSKDQIYDLDLQKAIDYINQKELEYKEAQFKMDRASLTKPHKVKIPSLDKLKEEIKELNAFKSFLKTTMSTGEIPADESVEVQPMGAAADGADIAGDA